MASDYGKWRRRRRLVVERDGGGYTVRDSRARARLVSYFQLVPFSSYERNKSRFIAVYRYGGLIIPRYGAGIKISRFAATVETSLGRVSAWRVAAIYIFARLNSGAKGEAKQRIRSRFIVHKRVAGY